MLLVHGVLRAADRAAVERVTAGPAGSRAVTAGPLAAAVSEVPDAELTAEDAVAHLDLLVALVASVPVLPLALGTVAPDDDAVRIDVLTAQAEELEQRLTAVADLVELRLDLAFDTDASVGAIAGADPAVRALAERARAPGAGMGEQMALGEAVAERVAEHQTALAEEWTRDVAAIAEQDVVLHADEQVQRTAYLVRRDRVADADAAVERLRAEAQGRAQLEYVGPLPVYSFLTEPDTPAPAPTSRWGW